jgi:hypothetical protein
MTPEQQRIAIAEACGWKLKPLAHASHQQVWMFNGIARRLPDYLNDLNAMHEAEKMLNFEQSVMFRHFLECNSDGPDAKFPTACAAMCHATPTQRAEAFLRTLGLWKETNPS